jgi:Uma2 family endonuclease
MLVVEKSKKQRPKKIPSHLIYEEMNGISLPYKGYLDVLKGKKKSEEIMGSSSLQSILVYAIGLFIGNHINRKKYFIASNEAGLHLGNGDNLANDIAIYEKENTILNDKYFINAPKIVVEVDIKIDLNETNWTNEWDYVIEKSNKMLQFGVDKVIWITTKSKKIFVSSKTERWYMIDFNEDIPLLDDCVLNLANLLQEEDIQI